MTGGDTLSIMRSSLFYTRGPHTVMEELRTMGSDVRIADAG